MRKTYQNKIKYSQYCPRCNHKWYSYKRHPKVCPLCQLHLNEPFKVKIKTIKTKNKKTYFCTICNRIHRDGSKLYRIHYHWRKINDGEAFA